MIAAALCLVIAVSDGDTLRARCGEPGRYEQVTIRLAEIDAPERGQPYAQQSKQALRAACFGTLASIRPVGRDRYGRTVGPVECRGEDASLQQVRSGLAWAFTRYLTDPAIEHQQHAARTAQLGLWADASPRPPWEWRSTKRAVVAP